MFITFEGVDGSGKTTQAQLLKEFLENKGHSVLLTREPGGTKFAEAIRNLLLHIHDPINPMTEVYLYCAARNEHYHKIILPALKEGKIVISDRFYDSTIAYQGAGRKLGIDKMIEMNQEFILNSKPEITFFLDTPLSIIEERLNRKKMDRMEKAGIHFLADVREGYLEIMRREPKRVFSINGRLTETDINRLIIEKFLEQISL
ncbi:dTMP kinase [endosymbiont 'TC1' of Trimyema compressum]|uniref:dTMP kinase n=1 Tax=endosymbiont 'TC1' of Trimyema compressum TaxID=243899 RepID=UPI000B4CB67B|nr:dTMP kinase [endosymbiont 'TC1' of Trimyema compressum]